MWPCRWRTGAALRAYARREGSRSSRDVRKSFTPSQEIQRMHGSSVKMRDGSMEESPAGDVASEIECWDEWLSTFALGSSMDTRYPDLARYLFEERCAPVIPPTLHPATQATVVMAPQYGLDPAIPTVGAAAGMIPGVSVPGSLPAARTPSLSIPMQRTMAGHAPATLPMPLLPVAPLLPEAPLVWSPGIWGPGPADVSSKQLQPAGSWPGPASDSDAVSPAMQGRHSMFAGQGSTYALHSAPLEMLDAKNDMDRLYETCLRTVFHSPSESLSGSYKGVTYHRRTRLYEGHLWHHGKQLYLGSFPELESAVRAHDVMVLHCKPDADALLQFPRSDYAAVEGLAQSLTQDQVMRVLRRVGRSFKSRPSLEAPREAVPGSREPPEPRRASAEDLLRAWTSEPAPQEGQGSQGSGLAELLRW